MKLFSLPVAAAMLLLSSATCGQNRNVTGDRVPDPKRIDFDGIDRPGKQKFSTGADRTATYLPYLKGKRVAMLVNNTSIIGQSSSVDSLQKRGVTIVRIFGPEHGFRGNASNGDHVGDETDARTGIQVVSLYGKKIKPAKEELADVDLMIFDVQDVGVRFYTYINKLRDIMEACAENGKELMIFDRPNPNGYLVDGPVLDMALKSGIGQFPIPIAHGMTIGEFALMINGEGWIPGGLRCKLNIVKMTGYRHDLDYTLPVAPSPNLNTQQSVLLYPSLCPFEGTVISQGRGTLMPFTVLGAPELKGAYSFAFTPKSIPGMSEAPLYKDQVCYGLDLRKYDAGKLRRSGKLNLDWFFETYRAFPDKARFFDFTQSKAMGNFDKLIGVSSFRQQLIAGKSEKEIRQSWEPGLSQYKQMRKKYLLYE